MATTNELIATRGCNAGASRPIGPLTRLALALALACGAGSAAAQEGIPNTDNQTTCPGFRAGNVLNCTANDGASQAVFTPVAGGGTCIAGELVEVNVDITLESTTGADRNDYAFFAGLQGNSPTLTTAGEICSGTTFTLASTFPFENNDGDACADFDGNEIGTSNADGITVLCDPNPDGTLSVPFTLTYQQNEGDVCTGPNDARPGTGSKCFAGVGTVEGLLVQGFVNVTKVTVGGEIPQDFAFTASGDATPTPTSFTLDTDSGDATFSNTQQVQMPIVQGADRTLTIDEAATPGFEVTDISCVPAQGSGPLVAFTPNIANGSFSVDLNDVSFGADCTVTNAPAVTRVGAAKEIVNSDGGLFNLTVEGATTTDVGDGGATPLVTVTDGAQVNISEAAGTGADLADYTISYSCVNEDATVLASGTTAVIPAFVPTAGQDTICTFTNTRTLSADVSLDKALVTVGPFIAGQTISYTITVANAGPDTATDVLVSDTPSNVTVTNISAPCASGFPCTIPSIASGGSVVITVTGTIDNATPGQDGMIDFGNSASAVSPVADPNPDNNTDGQFDKAEPQAPALTLDKTTTTATYDSVGDTISYSYLVTNSGNVGLAGPVTVADDKATVSCPDVATVGDLDATLDPGEAVTCTATYTVVQADIDSGSVTNIATASAGGTSSNSDTVTVTGTQTSTVSLDKSANPTTYSAVGQMITYTYVVTNTGNTTLTGPATVADNKVTVTCPAGDLAPGATVNCTATYTITQADINAGSVVNIASATVEGVVSNTDTVTVTATQSTGVTLDKTSTTTGYDSVGDTLSYSYVVTNTGNVSLAGPVTVADNRATVVCPAVSTVGNLNATLDPGETITCTATYVVTQADINAGNVTNTATATVGGTNSNPDTVIINATVTSGLTLDKTTTSTGYNAAGQSIPYSYVVTNTGNATLAGPVTVTDNRVSVTCPAGSLAPGASITCTATYTTTQADITAGSVTNTATASANGVTSNTDSVTVVSTFVPPVVINAQPVPVDSKWMLIAIALLLGFAAQRRIAAARRG